MPFASFRSNLGIAKDNPSTYLTAAIIATATSIPVNGTGVPAASTIYFVDGVNSESRTVTAGGGTATLTVAATTFAHPVNTPIVWQLTASLGPADFMPVTSLDPYESIANLPDMGIRGSN